MSTQNATKEAGIGFYYVLSMTIYAQNKITKNIYIIFIIWQPRDMIDYQLGFDKALPLLLPEEFDDDFTFNTFFSTSTFVSVTGALTGRVVAGIERVGGFGGRAWMIVFSAVLLESLTCFSRGRLCCLCCRSCCFAED